MSETPFRCGMEAVVDIVGGKWKVLILYHLSHQRLRFSALQRQVGDISEKMLSQQLKEMVSDGLLRRIDFRTVPPHVEYETTAFGLDLGRSMAPICEWGSRNMDAVAAISEARAARQGTSVRKASAIVAGGSPVRRRQPSDRTLQNPSTPD